MKLQIRQSIFETNSSSTHSLQIVQNDQVQNIIFDKLRELSEDNHSETEYIEKDTLNLTGFELESGEESSYVAQIIKSPLYKIQYLFNVLCNKVFGWEKINKEKLQKSKEYRWFEETVLNFLSKKYINITKLNIDPPEYLYTLEYDKNFDINVFNSREEFNKAFNKVMSDDYTILITDIPYRVWESHKISIY